MNIILKPIIKAMEAELDRQHEHSSIHGLVVSRTDEPSTLQLHGPVDLEALAQVAWDASLTQAQKTVHDIANDLKGEEQTYLYDCGRGQGSVRATSLEEAKHRAGKDAGWNDRATNVRLATDDELAVRKAMGGDNA